MPRSPIFVFWDNSNIFIPAQEVAASYEKFVDTKAVRIHFQQLLDLVRVGRKIEHAVVVGSIPAELNLVWGRLRATGVQVELFERGAGTHTEQGVDQCLQVHMLRALADCEPAVAVLLTGDGKGYDAGVGFHADLERMYARGWGIEVVSWDIACNARLRSWAQEVGVYLKLEDYYRSVTFVEGGRLAAPIGRHNRTVTHPRVV